MKENRLTKILRALCSPRNISSENVGKLFHYTYDEKKGKIVSQDNVVFKLSRIDQFLDRNEGFHILEPFYHACGDLYENKIIDENFYKTLLSIKQYDILNSFLGVWVLCFSKNGNSVFLKRRYAAGKGWILGIVSNCLDEICIDFPGNYGTINLYEVVYSFNKMVRVIENAIKKYYKHYKNEPTEQSVCKQEIASWLGEYSLIYKSADYKFEEEIRLVCKFVPDFIGWQNEEYGVRFESSVSGYDATMKMILDKKLLVYESQNLDVCFDTTLNKTILSGEEVRKLL